MAAASSSGVPGRYRSEGPVEHVRNESGGKDRHRIHAMFGAGVGAMSERFAKLLVRLAVTPHKS